MTASNFPEPESTQDKLRRLIDRPLSELFEPRLRAIKILVMYGQLDGDHHKAWAIDQAVHELLGPDYEAFIAMYQDGPDGSHSYEWETGIAP